MITQLFYKGVSVMKNDEYVMYAKMKGNNCLDKVQKLDVAEKTAYPKKKKTIAWNCGIPPPPYVLYKKAYWTGGGTAKNLYDTY